MSIKESVFYSADKNAKEKMICDLGRYIVDNESTVRKTAKHFGISKSTVHKNLTVLLKEIDFDLFKETQAVLQKNKSERHLRGGFATKMKYLNSKQTSWNKGDKIEI